VDESVDGVVLLIGSGWRTYREYLLRGLAERAALWLLDEEEPTWQLPYIVGATAVPAQPSGFPDRTAQIEAAVRVAGDRKVLGVVTYDELEVTTAADIAERLGVPGLTVEGAENCKDKNRSRAALTAAGLPQPGFALTHDLATATAAAERIGYPVIVKPRGMAASIGVVRAEKPADLAAAFGVAEKARHTGPPDYVRGVLVEELVEGPEISVDGAVSAGEYQPFCLARKNLGLLPYFEEVGHRVDAADPLLADADLRRVLADTHRALGLPDGITHTEVRLTARGPVVIEVNARLGGDMIPYLGSLATGVDPGRVAAEVAMGVRPDLTPTVHRCAAIRFLYPPEDCRVTEISVPAPGAVPGLVEARAIVPPGAELRLPPRMHLGRYAFLIATAPDPESCEAALDAAAALCDLRYEALDMSQPYEGRPW
jgi:biotin carboxylase